eukprot:1157356-Pelagomonas_calceolata.AAC.1
MVISIQTFSKERQNTRWQKKGGTRGSPKKARQKAEGKERKEERGTCLVALRWRGLTALVCVDLSSDSLAVLFGGRRYIGGPLFKTIDVANSTWFIVYQRLIKHCPPWFRAHADTGVIHMLLLKRCRKGRYTAGTLDQGHSATAKPLPGISSNSNNSNTAVMNQEDSDTTCIAAGNESSNVVLGKQASLVPAKQDQPRKVFTAADTFWWALFKDAPEQEALPLQHPPTAYYWAPDEEGSTPTY